MTAALAGLAIASGTVGLVFGSFLNVVIWRVPRGLSVVRPRSACPACGHALRAIDNIPLVSWVSLGARCRNCRVAISPQYPLVELVTGSAFAVLAAWAGFGLVSADSAPAAAAAGLTLAALFVLAACSIALAVIDIRLHRLPNPIVLFLAASGVILLGTGAFIAGDLWALARAVIGGAAAFALFFIAAFIKPEGMGLGDVKLAGALGLYLGYFGWGALVVGFFAAFLLGGVVGLIGILARRIDRRGGIAFGPWMLLGAWIGIVAGEHIAREYMSFIGITG